MGDGRKEARESKVMKEAKETLVRRKLKEKFDNNAVETTQIKQPTSYMHVKHSSNTFTTTIDNPKLNDS